MFTRLPYDDEIDRPANMAHDGRRHQEKLAAYDHWYRALNDGFSLLDTIPYVNRFNAYSAWMQTIDDRAVDTLKMAVNYLLLDFKDKEGIKTHEKQEGHSKREQIEELMQLLNQYESSSKQA